MTEHIHWGQDPSKTDLQQNGVNTLVFFHYPCRDGFASAWITSRALPRRFTWFWPVNYTDPMWACADDRRGEVEAAFTDWSIFDGKSVFIVDFSFPMGVLRAIAKRAEKVWVFDHHLKFAQLLAEDFDIEIPERPSLSGNEHIAASQTDPIVLTEGNMTICFHFFRCGAELIGDFFEAQLSADWLKPFTKLLADRDLWVWLDENSPVFHAGMGLIDDDFAVWDKCIPKIVGTSTGWMEHQGIGKALLKSEGKIVEGRANQAFHVAFPYQGKRVEIPTVNSTGLASETCHAMLALFPEAPFVAAYFDLDASTRVWSLRSRKEDGVNVSDVARQFGGGGHAAAAGFRASPNVDLAKGLYLPSSSSEVSAESALAQIRDLYLEDDPDGAPVQAEEWPPAADFMEDVSWILRSAGCWFDEDNHPTEYPYA